MLDVDQVTLRYGTAVAVDDVSLRVERGRLVGFLGPNGAGKTSTMRMIMGIAAPDAGRTSWDGAPITREVRRRFGYMPEERGLYTRMPIARQLVYLARLHGLAPRWAEENASMWIEKLGLTDRRDSRLGELSHGNQQRVQLAAAFVHEPELVVLDEPFSGLDPIAVVELSALLREAADAGTAVLLSSHQLELVEDLCDAVVIVNRGRVVLAGDVAALRRASGIRRVRVSYRDGTDASVADLPGVVWDEDAMAFVLEGDGEAGSLMKAAARRGDVDEIAIELPSLTDLFRKAVA